MKKEKINITVIIIFLTILSFMSIGFAKYQKILDFSGIAVVEPDGILEVKSITLTSSSNVISSNPPTYSNGDITFDVNFGGSESEFYALYTVYVENNSSYDHVFNAFDFNTTVTGTNNATGTLSIELDGIESGDVIEAKTNITFTIKLILTPSDSSQQYDVDVTGKIEDSPTESGSFLASTETTSIDLRETNSMVPVVVEIVNTHETAATFTPYTNNSNFILTDSNGNTPSNLTVAGNTTQSFTFYISKNGDPHFLQDSVTIRLNMDSTSFGRGVTGDITVLVDKYTEQDTTPPVISSISISKNSSEGVIDVEWSGSDNSNSDVTYIVKLYNASNTEVASFTSTTSSNTTQTGQFTNISQGTSTVTYTAKIYGTDTSGNTSNTVSSNSISVKWRASVTYNLTDAKSSNTSTSVLIGSSYTTTLSYSGSNGYISSSSVVITMNGVTIVDEGEVSSGVSGVTYNDSSDTLTINSVTGDISITAKGVDNGCLLEGTKIALAGGKYKNIEDITYNDLLKVYDHENNKFSYAYPTFIERKHTSENSVYKVITLSDGTTLKTFGTHGVYSPTYNEYIDVESDKFKVGIEIVKEGTNTLKKVKVIKIEEKKDEFNYYSITTTNYYNFFADNVLSSTGITMLMNIWEFNNDYSYRLNRKNIIEDKNNYISYNVVSDFMDEYLYYGLRVSDLGYIFTSKMYSYDELPQLINMFKKIINNCIDEPDKINGNRYWMVTNSYDVVDDENNYLQKEGSTYIIPKVQNTTKWYNTADGKIYNYQDKIIIRNGTHLIALN